MVKIEYGIGYITYDGFFLDREDIFNAKRNVRGIETG